MEPTQEMLDTMLHDIAGQEGISIVKFIQDKRNVSEFKIADKTKLGINQVRNLLYKFYNYNLVESVRKKDKKKGWYIYYWTFKNHTAKIVFKDLKTKQIEVLRKQLEKENGTDFFFCPKNHGRVTFETALELGFKCPECSTVLKEEDNAPKIVSIKKRIEALEQEVGTAQV